MFLRWRGHRSRNSAISKISSYINPAQNTKPENTCWRRLPQPQSRNATALSVSRSKKAYVFVCIHTPESKPEVQGPGHPKHEPTKHVLEATPTAPSPAMPQPCPVSEAKSVCFRMHSDSGIRTPDSRAQGPDSRAQAPGSIGPRAEAPGLRAQGPSSELQNLMSTAWALRSYQIFIEYEWTHCAQRRSIFWASGYRA